MGTIIPQPIAQYLASLNRLGDPVLEDIARQGHELDVPCIDAEVGALLRVLAAAIGARRVIEIGGGIGYSAIWLARAMPPGGLLVSFEINPARASAAAANFTRAGVSDRANVMVGDAQRLVSKVSGPFDLIFNDGDKRQHDALHDRLVALLRPRGLLITDNALWDGEVVPGYVAAPSRDTEETRAIAAYNERLARDPRLQTTVVPLRDGVAISVKNRDE